MPRYHQHKKTNRYSNEFKSKAVQLSLMQGVQVQEVAQALDIHPFMLSRWRKEYREGKLVPDRRKKVVSFKRDEAEINTIKKNAHMESFFHTLKAELIRAREFASERELRLALKSYINRFYNHKRLHSGIGYRPPAEFERMVA